MLPNIPTDNLYKFMFMSGVLLCIFGIYSYTNAFDVYIEQRAARYVDSIRLNHFLNNTDTGRYRIDTTTGNSFLQESTEMRNLAHKHWLESEINSIAIPIKSNRALNCVKFGIFMMFIGGILWYFKVQIYQDLLLKSQVVKSGPEILIPKYSSFKKFLIIALFLILIFLFFYSKILEYMLGLKL